MSDTAFGHLADRQRGIALMMSLVLLAVLSLVGVTAMQGSVLQERMAGGQSTLQDAFLEAEADLVRQLNCVLDNSDDMPNLEAECGLVIDPDTNTLELTANAVHATGARQVLAMNVRLNVLGEGDEGDERAGGFNSNAAVSCFGAECDVSPGPGAADYGIDGRDYTAPDLTQGENCGIQGAHTRDFADADVRQDVAGAIVPEGDISDRPGAGGGGGRGGPPGGGGGGGPSGIIGSPDVIDNSTHYEATYGHSTAHAVNEFNQLINSLVQGREPSSHAVGAYEEGIYYAGEGDEITFSGEGQSGFGGIVILEGGSLNLDGNSCFSGLVLVRGGGTVTGGTSAIIGSVISIPGFDEQGEPLESALDTAGNTSFFYSAEALRRAGEIWDEEDDDDGDGPSGIAEWGGWRAPLNL
ncbi:PilX N-terminal domain-containing pilus assembly protein [Alkalilimnicola ehrlichii MLHE-1]|uniref:Type 4 fimbrial biogenesis protein PilX N-terminal domain-containing protein n=1 Tax=Alkalilimnicola ehrlichii (strain ATCC BAA-1101 / DSM 17681 / MLHE-1) TaxID=187272 RepID=Q0AC26_ALKEH|nr:pilus assembly PilX N-terminal domain-containing protein [Alkalilimnicola ehrlichii]ABI55611.1 hypothetical protein Mlg_0256 [Alkalilimnicola ehrlichii MLHE-1]